ncbi:MAG: ferritin-like domain-containing protein [Deltaproteobacteria bacterium]
METLKDLFIDQLEDIYYAENQIVDALPKMIEAASSSELKEAFEKHLDETKGQIERLEKVFDILDLEPEKKKCEAIEGIIDEGEELIEMKDEIDPDVLDAGLIASAQRVEHYEIAVYGTIRRFAKRIGEEEAADLLTQNLDQEYDADQKLTRIAEDTVNKEAAE